MGWGIPWVSSARTDFNVDLGFSSSEEQTREAIAPMLEAGDAPKGRDEGEAWQMWIRRHDEYGSE
jgi:predicted dithiol-disulfide oxidoreductase (DUF899 family)